MSRELYDLCRKYKYFYNKHKDVKSWDKKYHDIDLSDAVATTKIQLGLVENELQKALFKEFNVDCNSIEVHENVGTPMFGFGRMGKVFSRESEVRLTDSTRFLNLLSEYMYELRGSNARI